MTVGEEIGAIPADPSLEGSALLASDLGETTTELLLRTNGWRLLESQPVQFMYRPGRRMTIRRSVLGERGDRQRRFSVISEARREPSRTTRSTPTGDLPDPVLIGPGVRMWAFPHDPYLRDLHRALTIEGAREIAEAVTGWPTSVRSTVVRYRPGKRAVLRYEVRPRGQGRAEPVIMYVKIMRTPRADRVERVAEVAPPVPAVSFPSARPFPGTLVFRSVPGADLRQILLAGGPAPEAGRLAELVGSFASWADPRTPGPGTAESRLAGTTELLTIVLPHLGSRLARLAASIESGLRPAQRVVVHGDMHEGQVMVHPDGRLVVIDVDEIGPGDPALDAANALAHLGALAESHPEAAGRLLLYRSDLRAAYQASMGWSSEDLAVRESIALLQLAGGPLRVLSPQWPQRVEARLALAEQALQT